MTEKVLNVGLEIDIRLFVLLNHMHLGAHWEQFTPTHQTLMQLHAHNVTMIPDDFRVAPIAFINDYAPYFGH